NPTVGTSGANGSTGNGFASFLLGYGTDNTSSSVTEPARTADQNLYKAIYAGDTFQLTRKITLNLGVRVDLQGDWTERFNRIVVFNPSETSPIGAAAGMPNLKGAYDLVSSTQHPSRSAFSSWNHVSPRLGVSYQLDKNTVIRTGYGIFYLPVDIRWNDAPHNLFINSFNTSWQAVQSDGVTPKNAADVTALKTQVHNPFAGNCPPPNTALCTGPVQSGGIGTNPTVMAAQLLLPFPQYDNVAMSEPDNRDSVYHSMQAKVEKRFA